MRHPRVVDIPGIGLIRFRPSRRVRIPRIRVQPFGLPEVTMPERMSFRTAGRLIHGRRDWIIRQSGRAKSCERNRLDLGPPTRELNAAWARSVLKARIEQLARENGFTITGVTIRAQRTRWGSCSVRNRISLNIQLMVLPQRLRDYVLLHELVHTRIKHHGPEFWKELDRYVDDARGLRNELAGIGLQPR